MLNAAQQIAPFFGTRLFLKQCHRERQARACSHFAAKVEFRINRVLEVAHSLNPAPPDIGQGIRNLQQFFLRRPIRRDRLALRCPMLQQAGCGESEGTSPHTIRRQLRHRGSVFRCCLFAVGAALAHDENAKCGMRDLRRHVDVVFVTFKRIEIIRETRPVPWQPFLHNDFRNVLNPLHQTDQHVVMIRADWCETDTAIAHQDRRHTVRRRRQNLVRPGDLRVVMGMHIDKPGNNDPVRGVDLLAPRARYLTYLGNPSIRDRHITRVRRRPGSIDNGSAADNQIK